MEFVSSRERHEERDDELGYIGSDRRRAQARAKVCFGVLQLFLFSRRYYSSSLSQQDSFPSFAPTVLTTQTPIVNNRETMLLSAFAMPLTATLISMCTDLWLAASCQVLTWPNQFASGRLRQSQRMLLTKLRNINIKHTNPTTGNNCCHLGRGNS